MSFGYQRQPRIFMHDTQRLTAYLQAEDEETPVPLTEIDSVTFSIKRPEDHDRASYIRIQDALYIESTEPGAFGNQYTVEIVDPGSAGALDVTLTVFDLVITLAHNGTETTTTVGDVIEAMQDDVDIYPFLTASVDSNDPLPDTARTDLVLTELAETSLSHGEGPILYRVAGTVEDDGLGTYLVPSTITTQPGEYLAVARFTLTDGQIKSVSVDFDVVDMFEDMGPYPGDGVVAGAWGKLEDCFDSELGGPWLRDMTMARFDKSRMRSFIGDALFDINNQMPQTAFSEDSYPYGSSDGGDALMSQGILCAAIRHLMRSYTEQPDVSNSPVGFLDRKRYQQAWKAIYDIEWALYLRWLALYKRRLYTTGARLLVSSKAGRLYGPNVRTRNVGRGMYF